MSASFPCANCPDQMVTVRPIGIPRCDRCGAAYEVDRAFPPPDGSDEPKPMVLISVASAIRITGRCVCCGQPTKVAPYARFGLVRFKDCNPCCWHIAEVTDKCCEVCQAPITIQIDESLAPEWRARASAE